MGITHQDRISILITFVCGVLVGGYLYVTGFLPTFHLPEAATQEVYEKLVVVADTYGGCVDTANCLSFQVLYDRSYQAVLGASVEEVAFSGSVSRSAMNELVRALSQEALVANTAPLAVPVCRNAGEGASNFRFQITFGGVNYTLDTCVSAIDYESDLWQALRRVYTEVAADVP